MPDHTPFKRCSKCQRDLPFSDFHRNRNNPSGRVSHCKECIRNARGSTKRPVLNVGEGLRRCAICGEAKPLADFYKQKTGYKGQCKGCYNLVRGCTPKAPRRTDGLKQCTACKRDLPATANYFSPSKYADGLQSCCKDCGKRRDREWKRANHDRHIAFNRDWQRRNPDKVIEYGKRTRMRNRPAHAVHEQKRRTLKRGLPASFTKNDWCHCLEYWHGCCAVCGRPPGLWHTLSIDHWIALSNPDCPGTIPENILPLCCGVGGCNNSKSNKEPIAWLRARVGSVRAAKKLKEIQAYFSSVRSSRERSK